MSTPAQQLSEFVHGVRYCGVPEPVRGAVMRCLVDTVGVGLASQGMTYAKMLTDLVLGWGGTGESTVMAAGARVPAPNAILANGNMVGGIDYDNTHGEGMVHIGACIVPTALAMAEKVGANGEALMDAIVAGVEAQGRIASAALGNFHARGFHATFVTGCFASAMTAGKLLGLTPPQLANALGIAGTQASGTFEWLEDGSWSKRFGPGWAGHGGTIAALLAERGYTGPATIFEGRFGLYRSHLGEGNYSLERLTRGLGSEWEAPIMMHKRYPCCHYNHSAINAARAIRRKNRVNPADIREVECIVQPEGVPIAAEPRDQLVRPHTTFQALFSIYYAVAVALLRDSVGIDAFSEEAIRDPEVLDLSERVRYTTNEAVRRDPALPASVIVRLRDGREIREDDEGDRVHPMNDEEIADKFRWNARRSLPDEQVEQLLGALWNAPSAPNLGDLMALTVVPTR